MSTAMVDWRWMSKGGLMLDSTGDISFTASPWECLTAMVATRLKAALDGWKLYRIGADLANLIGSTVSAELELSIQRQVQASLSQDFLPAGSFTVTTLPVGDQVSPSFRNQKHLARAGARPKQATPRSGPRVFLAPHMLFKAGRLEWSLHPSTTKTSRARARPEPHQ